MGIELAYVQKFMVRFYSYNRADFPENVRVIPRKSTRSRDRKHTEAVGEEFLRNEFVEEGQDLAQRGRIREGRIDTGEIVYNGENGVTFPTLAAGLLDDEYIINNAHISQKEKKGRAQYILTFTFEYDVEPAENADELLELFQYYAEDFYDMFVWLNPDSTSTINCMNRNGGKLRQELLIEDGEICLEPIMQPAS